MQVRFRRMTGTAGALAAVLQVALLTGATGCAWGAEPAWRKDYATAQAQAKATHRLVMVDFATSWCVWCKRLDTDTYSDTKVAKQLSTEFVPVKVDAEKEGAPQAQKYGVSGFPTILFVNDSGGVEGRITGYLPPKEFGEKLTQIATAHRDLPKWEAKRKASPGNADVNAHLATIYTIQSDLPKAEARLAAAEKGDPKHKSGMLTQAYLTLGTAYQDSEEWDKAMAVFHKVVRSGATTEDRASGNLGIAVCHLAHRDYKPALPYLKAATVPGASTKVKTQAQSYLTQIRKHGLDK